MFVHNATYVFSKSHFSPASLEAAWFTPNLETYKSRNHLNDQPIKGSGPHLLPRCFASLINWDTKKVCVLELQPAVLALSQPGVRIYIFFCLVYRRCLIIENTVPLLLVGMSGAFFSNVSVSLFRIGTRLQQLVTLPRFHQKQNGLILEWAKCRVLFPVNRNMVCFAMGSIGSKRRILWEWRGRTRTRLAGCKALNVEEQSQQKTERKQHVKS